MTKSLSEQQKNAIRSYIRKGYSANQIQVSLKNRHMGIRRKVLLAEVRKIKGQKLKVGTAKHIPKKYARARWKARAKRIRLRPLGVKRVLLTGLHKGKLTSKTQHGSGKELRRWVLDEMTGGYWDEKPKVFS